MSYIYENNQRIAQALNTVVSRNVRDMLRRHGLNNCSYFNSDVANGRLIVNVDLSKVVEDYAAAFFVNRNSHILPLALESVETIDYGIKKLNERVRVLSTCAMDNDEHAHVYHENGVGEPLVMEGKSYAATVQRFRDELEVLRDEHDNIIRKWIAIEDGTRHAKTYDFGVVETELQEQRKKVEAQNHVVKTEITNKAQMLDAIKAGYALKSRALAESESYITIQLARTQLAVATLTQFKSAFIAAYKDMDTIAQLFDEAWALYKRLP